MSSQTARRTQNILNQLVAHSDEGLLNHVVRNMHTKIIFSEEVKEALDHGRPVVALESTLISHGLPYPQNEEIGRELENIVRDGGAVPATIAIMNGKICVGLNAEQLSLLASPNSKVAKVSRRDIPFVLSTGGIGATTVAATSLIASRCGIRVFATGGIGGVHRDGHITMDVSADLTELSRTQIVVCSAGVKSILDIGRTLEYLETMGVAVVGYKTEEFPAFFVPRSGYKAPLTANSAKQCAEMMNNNLILGIESGMLVAIPIPEELAADGEIVEAAIEQALDEVNQKQILGRDITPYILKRVAELTGGKSLEANLSLIRNNTRVATNIAVELSQLKDYHVATSTQNRPVVIGVSAIDIIATAKNLQLERSNIGKVEMYPGGVGRNMAEGLARLGENPIFISRVGRDSLGNFLLDDFRSIPMETKHISVSDECGTAVYNAVIDNGEMHTAVNDFSVVNEFTTEFVEQYRDIVQSGSFLVLDCNLPAHTLYSLAKMARKKRIKIWVDPTSTSKCERLIPIIKKADFISPNIAELRTLATQLDPHINPNSKVRHLASALLQKGAKTIVIKRGKKGVIIVTKNLYYKMAALPVEEVINVTGAGDSFNAGMIHGLINKLDVLQAAELGLEYARLSIQSMYAINREQSLTIQRQV